MFSTFLIANRQFYGKVNDELYTETYKGKEGDICLFDKVLSLGEKIGQPYVEGCSVKCQIIKHGKNKKIRILKFKSQKRHRKVTGFRKTYTKFKIVDIIAK